MPVQAAPTALHPGLHTELYQIMQIAAYHADGLWGEATFDLTLRAGPDGADRAMVVGIEAAIEQTLAMGFGEEEVDWLAAQPALAPFPRSFFAGLRRLRFSGEVAAVRDGTVLSAGAPVLRVTAPLTEVGLLETRLVSAVSFATGVATRAAGLVAAAAGRPLIDFAARRCPDVESAAASSRAARIAGFAGTTNALAAFRYGLPPWAVGSDAMLAAWGDPEAATLACKQHFGDRLHLDLPAGDLHAAVRRLAPLGRALACVRVDRDDLAEALPLVRRAFDRHGLPFVRLLATGGLDGPAIHALVTANAPADLFGVGGALLDGAPARMGFKMVELVRGTEPTPVPGSGWPGRKQLIRHADHDLLCLDVEALGGRSTGTPLLEVLVRRGERVQAAEPIELSRARAAQNAPLLAPQAKRALRASPALQSLAERAKHP